jgi:hypothetical protein
MCVVKCALRKAMRFESPSQRESTGNEDGAKAADAQFDAFRDTVDAYVNITSRMLRRASLALAHHMTRVAEAGQRIPDLRSKGDTYWKDWLRLGSGAGDERTPGRGFGAAADVEAAQIDESHALVAEALGPCLGDGPGYIAKPPEYFDQVLNYAGHTLRTAVDNNAWVPLFSRLARLLKHELAAMPDAQGIKTYDVLSAARWPQRPDLHGWPHSVRALIAEVRRRLDASLDTCLHDEYGKRLDFPTLFAFNYWMQQRFEALGQRRMRLSPIFDVRRAHVRLDAKTLLSLLRTRAAPGSDSAERLRELQEMEKRAAGDGSRFRDPDRFMLPPRPEKEKDEGREAAKRRKAEYDDEVAKVRATAAYAAQKAKYDALVAAQRRLVASFFVDAKVLGKRGWTFDCSIATDGVAVSLQFSCKERRAKQRPKRKARAQTRAAAAGGGGDADYDRELVTELDDRIVLGLDPGRANLATVTYLDKAGQSQTWRLSRGEYYAKSGIALRERRGARRNAAMADAWVSLGGEGRALSTARAADIEGYLAAYAAMREPWWLQALPRRTSRSELQAYSGKRRVLDSFFAKIARVVKKAFPNKEATVAYGSAGQKMRPTGKGEVAVPTTGTFAACCRVFRNGATAVVDESYTTVVHWSTGTRKELVYKVPALTPSGKLTERLEHSRGNRPPVVHEVDRPAVEAYLQRKKAQDKKRRGGPGAAEVAGGGQPPLPPPQGAAAMVRYPEVRGLRFVPEMRMYLDRDKSSALAIGRLRCMELLGRARPAPFCRGR